MGKFSSIFDGLDEYDELDDPVDMVLATDIKLSRAIKEAEDNGCVDADGIIEELIEKEELPMEINDYEPEPYHEEYDDAIMPDEVDAQIFREEYYDGDVGEDLDEDDDIDAVLDYDMQATEFSDISDEDDII